MGSIKMDNFINVLRDNNISLFTVNDISKIFSSGKSNIKLSLKRFKDKGIISSLTKNKYLFELAIERPSEYKMANFIYAPSYISLETAMSLNGIVDQFPYSITSVTCRKSKDVLYKGLTFSFTHINRGLFLDYQKQNDYLIAGDWKAIFDYFYLAFKNSRSKNNLNLINLKPDQKKKLISYTQKMEMKSKKKFVSFVKNNL